MLQPQTNREWKSASGRYDAAATPETGSDRLYDYYRRIVAGRDRVERGVHSVF